MARSTNTLRELTAKLECNIKVIPNFVNIRPKLYDIFVVESGIARMLIDHFYIKCRNPTDEFVIDPMLRAKYCHDKLPYFCKLCSYLRNMRNKLEHMEFISVEDLVRLLKETANFADKMMDNLLVWFLVDSLVSVLKELHEETNEESLNCECCPLCKRPFKGAVSLVVEKIPIPSETTFEELKKTEWREKLKGKNIRIKSGCFQDQIARFSSWAGTVVYVDLQGVGKKTLGKKTKIEILE